MERPWPDEYEEAWTRFSNTATLQSHYLENHCWVCEEIFDNNPNVSRHDHHIIPRAFGGVDGPQVSLCNAHHDLLHDFGKAFVSGNSSTINSLLSRIENMPPLPRVKIVWLGSRVYLAHKATKSDPNKLITVNISLKQTEIELLNSLSKSLGLSRTDVIRAALKKLTLSRMLRD